MTRTTVCLNSLAVVFALAGGSSTSIAQGATEPGGPSPAKAGWIAGATLVVPIAWMASGVAPSEAGKYVVATTLLAPIAGYAYGGIAAAGVAPAVRRIAVLGASALAISAICSNDQCSLFGGKDSNAGLAAAVGLTGAITFTVMTFRDIAHVPKAVREHNARRVAVVPTWSPRDHAAGVGVKIRF